LSEARADLDTVVSEFVVNYSTFAKKNPRLIEVGHSVDVAIAQANAEDDIRNPAQVFESKINATLEALKAKQLLDNSWVGQLRKFLTRLYPIARLALGLTGTIAEVSIFPKWVSDK
jgi:hypothetical protein